MNLNSLTIDAARTAVQERKTTALALAEAHYARIKQEDGQIGAFLTLSKERALEQADRNQGCDEHARRAYDRGIEDSREVSSAIRLHCRFTSGGGGCGHARQNQ